MQCLLLAVLKETLLLCFCSDDEVEKEIGSSSSLLDPQEPTDSETVRVYSTELLLNYILLPVEGIQCTCRLHSPTCTLYLFHWLQIASLTIAIHVYIYM